MFWPPVPNQDRFIAGVLPNLKQTLAFRPTATSYPVEVMRMLRSSNSVTRMEATSITIINVIIMATSMGVTVPAPSAIAIQRTSSHPTQTRALPEGIGSLSIR